MPNNEPDIDTVDDELEVRELKTQLDIDESREFTGIAVPYGIPAQLSDGTTEQFEYGSVKMPDGGIVIKDRHGGNGIGLISEGEHTPDGFKVRGKISKTKAGDDAYQLAKDKVFKHLSVEFRRAATKMVKDAETGINKITDVTIPNLAFALDPAYKGAKILEVRENQPIQKTKESEKMNETTITETDLDELREELNHKIQTSIGDLETREKNEIAESIFTTSGGALLKGIVAGDELATRAYTGATTAESAVRKGWVGDLTRIITDNSPLVGLYSQGVLPKEGTSLEYAQMDSDTISTAFDEQAAEGDDLDYGEIDVNLKNAAIKLYGGYTQLTIKEIERSSVNILDTNLRLMALGTGKAISRAFKTHWETAHAAQVTATNIVTVADGDVYSDYLSAAVDAACLLETLGLTLDHLVLNKTAFKRLMTIAGTDGRPVMLVTGNNGSNTIGELDIKALGGDLATIPVILGTSLTDSGELAAFGSKSAIRTYKDDAVQLSDENTINLSKTFSVYQEASIVNEIPSALIPITYTT